MRSLILLGIVVALAAAAPPSARAATDETATKTAKAYYQEGIKQYAIGEYQQALDNFKNGFLARPDAAFLYNIGQCYRFMGNHEEMVRAYKAYLRERPDAENRSDVETFIAVGEHELAKRPPRLPEAAQVPPGAALPGAGNPATATATEVRPTSRRWWIAGVVAGAAVVAGGVALGLAFGLPNNAPIPPGTDPTGTITFP